MFTHPYWKLCCITFDLESSNSIDFTLKEQTHHVYIVTIYRYFTFMRCFSFFFFFTKPHNNPTHTLLNIFVEYGTQSQTNEVKPCF